MFASFPCGLSKDCLLKSAVWKRKKKQGLCLILSLGGKQASKPLFPEQLRLVGRGMTGVSSVRFPKNFPTDLSLSTVWWAVLFHLSFLIYCPKQTAMAAENGKSGKE